MGAIGPWIRGQENPLPDRQHRRGGGFIAAYGAPSQVDDAVPGGSLHQGTAYRPAHAGDCPRPEAALRPSGRKRRRQPDAVHGRGLPARRHPVRQPGAALQGRGAGHHHPARLLDRRRRLHAGHERLCHRREGQGPSVPGRAAAAQGRDRRDCDRRRTGRRGNARQRLRAGRIPRGERRRGHRHVPRSGSAPAMERRRGARRLHRAVAALTTREIAGRLRRFYRGHTSPGRYRPHRRRLDFSISKPVSAITPCAPGPWDGSGPRHDRERLRSVRTVSAKGEPSFQLCDQAAIPWWSSRIRPVTSSAGL